MKNTFKYTIASLAFFAAAFSSGLDLGAQNLEEGTYMEKNGIAYAKRAIPNEDGTYTIDLEAFVTGEVTVTQVSVPADVVLVLDVSGSMKDAISSVSSYNEASVSGLYGTNYNNNTSTQYYYKYNDDYYSLYIGRGGTQGNRRYYLFFIVNGATYYINSSGQVVSNQPTDISNQNTNLLASNVQLYTQVTTTITKMDALKTAVSAFIDEIHHNDLYEDDTYDKPRDTPLGNQISIVKFATNYYGNTASITPGNHFTNLNGTNQGDESTNSHEYNCTEVRIGFTTTATEANVNSLKTAVNSLTATGATAADYGMNLAHLLINSLGEARVNTSKTVVFFTDGEPNHNSGFSTSVATSAISYSKQIKAITYGEGDDATHPSVYSVGVFDSTPPSGGNLDNFMNYISSNYPDATAYNSGGTKASSDYYMDASSGSAEDLKKIFTSIAHAAGGSGTTEVTSESAVTVDVVSTSFSVPTGGSAVQVLVAPCNGKTTIDGKEYLTFGEEKIPSEYDLDAITAKIDVAENKVSTSGFDFSTNWCGPDPTSTSAIHNYAYHGFKQIIRFVITVNDAAVGGPSVATNSAESGIYLDGSDTPLVTFNRPTVKLPVQIWIQKTGLVGEDSAVFTLYATPYVEGQEASVYMSDDYKKKWISFTKVIVNSGNMEEIDDPNNPGTKIKVKKLVGLDPDYFYKLKEDAWAFGYQYQDGDGIVYTVGEVTNPIKIENTPKEIHFDEDVVRNVFKEK